MAKFCPNLPEERKPTLKTSEDICQLIRETTSICAKSPTSSQMACHRSNKSITATMPLCQRNFFCTVDCKPGGVIPSENCADFEFKEAANTYGLFQPCLQWRPSPVGNGDIYWQSLLCSPPGKTDIQALLGKNTGTLSSGTSRAASN